jgi:very-short-patch-repair endonuclease
MTQPEIALWSRLKNRQLLKYKFRRQYSVGPFILDFYCPELKLAIEVDGENHDRSQAKESDQEHIERFGIQFLRFKNEEVEKQIERVLTSIEDFIKSLT